MKLGIISDLHLEFDHHEENRSNLLRKINNCNADHIMIAGDIHANDIAREQFLDDIDHPCTHVLGNHDFYGNEKIYSDQYENNFSVGGCLWTNFGDNPIVERHATRCITDFQAIKNVTVNDMKFQFNEQVEHIFSSDKEVVMTHFSPTIQAIEEKYKYDRLNKYFNNSLDRRIINSNKKLWIFGHIHSRWDFMLGDCRMVSNPVGYTNEIKEAFEMKVVTI